MTDPRGSADPQPAPADRGRTSRIASAVLTAIVLVSVVPLAITSLGALGRGDLGAAFFELIFLFLPISLGLVGALLTVRRPENRIGWLLLVSGVLAGVTFAAGEYGRLSLDAGRSDAPFVPLAAWIASWLFIPANGILLVFLPLLYPSGRLPSRRWRWLVAVGIVGIAAGTVGPAVAPGPMGPGAPVNPFGASEPLLGWIEAISLASNLVAPPVALLALGSLLVRFRRSTGVERQQIKWLLFIAAIVTVAFLISLLGLGPASDAAWAIVLITIGLLPVAIGLAILRYGLYEIDRIVNRALVYGAVTAILAGAFAAATALSQRLFISVAGQSSDGAVVLTTLVVVAVYAPVRKRVEAVVDRYFKYDQREYGRYLDELRRLLDLVEPAHAAGRLAREAMAHTEAIGVAVVDRDGAIVATAGTWPSEPGTAVDVPGRRVLAKVLLGPRRDGKPHAPRQLAALAEAAALASVAIRS